MYRYLILVFVVFIYFSCSTAQKTDEKILEISSITPTVLESSKMPTESKDQVNIELFGVVSQGTLLNKDASYEWEAEKIPMDIQSISPVQKDSTTDIDRSMIRDFYLEVSKKDSLNAILSVYAPGYYKVTLKGSTALLNSEYSVILKIGSPEFPRLNIKMNIPKVTGVGRSDFKGAVYLGYSDMPGFTRVDAADMQDDWFSTNIRINPFKSFSLSAGTHIVEDKEGNKDLASLSIIDGQDAPSLLYKIDNGKGQKILLSPVEIGKLSRSRKFSLYKTDKYRWTGGLYVSYLAWGEGEDGEIFSYIEKFISQDEPETSYTIGNAYQVKIFVGSFGHRVVPYDYFVYFSPEGTELEELNKRNSPEDRIYPYGFLLGRLGEEGTVFSIGKLFNYSYLGSIPIYHLTEGGIFIKQK